MNNFIDFHTVPNLKFDISKLQDGLLEVLKIKKYGAPKGITNFAAICLNQIPTFYEPKKITNINEIQKN